MRQEDVFNVSDTATVGAVGLTEAIPAALRSVRLRATFAKTLETWRPDLVLTFDSPSMMLRLCATAKSKGIPTVHCVAPQPARARDARPEYRIRLTDYYACFLTNLHFSIRTG